MFGMARSDDGETFIKKSLPLTLGESDLTSPAAVRLGSRLRLYYLTAGAIWAADAAPSEPRGLIARVAGQ